MPLIGYHVFGFQQEKVLAKNYNEETAKKGVCAGLVVRFAQLCYSDTPITKGLMKDNVFYAKLVQDKIDDEFHKEVVKNGGATEQHALTRASPYTGFISKCVYTDKGVEGVLSSVKSAPNIVNYIVLNFDGGQAHAIGIMIDKSKDWYAFDPNRGYFEGYDEKQLDDFLTCLADDYSLNYCAIKFWENLRLFRTPTLDKLTPFFKAKGLQ